jgi:hypothetical protein
MIVRLFLTDGGRRYLQGGPEDDCAYAFIQEPRVSAAGERLHIRFLFAGRAGTEVAGRCVGRGDNFDIVVSGVPRYDNGDLFLDDTEFDADNRLFEVFAPLIERQLAPLVRVRAHTHVGRYIAELTARGAGTVRLESLEIRSIELGVRSARLDADFLVAVTP